MTDVITVASWHGTGRGWRMLHGLTLDLALVAATLTIAAAVFHAIVIG